jgi:hypothetical protein
MKFMARLSNVEKSFSAFSLYGVICMGALDNSSLLFISSCRSGTAEKRSLILV